MMIPIDKILKKHNIVTIAELNNFCIENNIDIIIHNGKPYIEFEVTTIKCFVVSSDVQGMKQIIKAEMVNEDIRNVKMTQKQRLQKEMNDIKMGIDILQNRLSVLEFEYNYVEV